METIDKQWLRQLQSFLVALLQPVLGTSPQFMQYFTAPKMVIWAQAFTHETVSSSYNYENQEYTGDAILKAVFPKYLRNRFPKFDKNEYTELNNVYMSKMKQAELARNMGLSNFIRVTGMDRAILNLETDVFESFFGALDEVSNTIADGLGFINCYNMIVHLFRDVEIDENRARGSSKTQVIQIFVRFDLPKPIESVEGERSNEITVIVSPNVDKLIHNIIPNDILGRNRDQKYDKAQAEAYREAIDQLHDQGIIEIVEEQFQAQGRRDIQFTVSLNQAHLDFLRNYRIQLPSAVIGVATGSTKKEAEVEAYNQALATLARYGVTTDWAEKTKQQRDLEEPALRPYLPAARARLAKEGFASMRFFIPRKTTTPKGAIVQLVGLRNNGREELLAYTYAANTDKAYLIAKTTVIKQYALM
jgi:dsRNA-specific ribonuclease